MPFKAAKTAFKLECWERKFKVVKRKGVAPGEASGQNASFRRPQKRSERGQAAEDRGIGEGEEREIEMADCIIGEGEVCDAQCVKEAGWF